MMKARTVHGKFLVIVFFCPALIYQLEAAPRNGTVGVTLDMGGGNTCFSSRNSAILDISAGTISSSGTCKENGAGPDLLFSFSGTFPPGVGFKTGTASQIVNGVNSNLGFEGPFSYTSIGFNGILGNNLNINGTFEILTCTKDSITKNPTEIATFYNVQTDPISCANHSQLQTCGNEAEFDGDANYQFASCSVVSAEPIPTLSQWAMVFLIFSLSVTVYFKGIKQS